MNRLLRTNTIFCLLLAALCLVICGCSGSDLDTVKVSGKVTLDGGDWPMWGTITFVPVGEPPEGVPRKHGSAKFDTDGVYNVMTAGRVEGLVPGEYKIVVECYEQPPGINQDESPGKSFVDLKYVRTGTTDQTLTVKAGSGAIEYNHDFPSGK
ncbi:MAG: hypothetical protein HQ581_22205 [Planctomycetes bacterium]|nr:hypothetical protein [Planctomycetota bacterium]